MNYQNINELLYIKKDYSEIEKVLKNSSDFRSFNILGKINLWQGNLQEANNNFKNGNNILGCTYFNLFSNNLNEALILSSLIKDSSSCANWLYNLINILKDNLEVQFSYFQIRNFFEQDFELLFKYKKTEYIKKIILYLEFFEYFNREVYKYSGRVFFNNNDFVRAKKLLNKSLDIFYNDPETHFILGEIYKIEYNLSNAIKEYKIAEEVNNGYLPATKRLKEINNN